jgi:hypothetical protein
MRTGRPKRPLILTEDEQERLHRLRKKGGVGNGTG